MSGLDALILQCAPDVAHSTMAAIVRVESGGHPWAIGDNTAKKAVKPTPANYEEAVVVAKQLIGAGHSIDIGLAQINSKNLPKLGLTVEQVLEPCTNLYAGSKILKGFYEQAVAKYGPGTPALFHALSGYNTGSLYAGASYVRRIVDAAIKNTSGYQYASNITPYLDNSYSAWRQRVNTAPRRVDRSQQEILVTNSNSGAILLY